MLGAVIDWMGIFVFPLLSFLAFVAYLKDRDNKKLFLFFAHLSMFALFASKFLLSTPNGVAHGPQWYWVFILSAFLFYKKAGASIGGIKKSNPIVLNVVIILVFLFMAPLVYGIIQNHFLFNNGQVIQATVIDNVKLSIPDRYGSFDYIVYQFEKNGKLIRQNASVKSRLQGKRVEEFKKGDKIDVLYFNGLTVVKDNYKPNLMPGLYLVLIFSTIIIWAVYKRIKFSKES